MDIFEELHAEHEQVARLIATLEERGRDEKTLETLRTELTAHSKAEEQVFYKRLETEESVRDTVLEGYEEHKVVVKLLSDMAQTTADEEKFAAKVAVLKESVEHHVEEEEGTLFEGARPLLAEGEPESLYEEFEAAKAGLQAEAGVLAKGDARGTADTLLEDGAVSPRRKRMPSSPRP